MNARKIGEFSLSLCKGIAEALCQRLEIGHAEGDATRVNGCQLLLCTPAQVLRLTGESEWLAREQRDDSRRTQAKASVRG